MHRNYHDLPAEAAAVDLALRVFMPFLVVAVTSPVTCETAAAEAVDEAKVCTILDDPELFEVGLLDPEFRLDFSSATELVVAVATAFFFS